MRTHGTLVKWNDDRGFGFIEPSVGTEEIFVHISAFPRDGVRPRTGEIISFDVDPRSDGKRRALRVMRPGSKAMRRRAHPRPAMRSRSPFAAAAGLLIVAAMGWYGYSCYDSEYKPAPTPTAQAIHTRHALLAQTFSCDGRTRCSQMTSCAEATYFLKQCPSIQMDGDGDGKPCESQWCGGSWAD